MAITLVGQAAASATTVTIPAHQAGDMLVMFAYNSASTSLPALPSGWTSVQATGANANSSRTAYRIATASGTASGTWTNANRLICIVYRGTRTLSAGANAQGAGTGTAVTYTATTLTGGGNGWVVSFVGHRTATTLTTPSGLARRATQGAAPIVGVDDTDGAVATYALKTLTADASASWRSQTFEVVEAPAPPAKADTLVTDFTTNEGLFTLTGSNVITGGQLQLPYTTAYDTVISNSRYDLTSSSVTAQIIPSTAHQNNETWFAFGDTGGVFDAPNTLQMIVSSGTLYLRERAASVASDVSLTYDPATMIWWRFREASGTVYWETAPAYSGPWTVRRSKAAAWVPSAHYAKFSAGNFTATQTSSLAVDNVNTAGAATPVYDPEQFLVFFYG